MAIEHRTFKGRQARARKYDWDTWLDGRVWELEHDVDFTVKQLAMEQMTRMAAARREKKVHVSRMQNGNLMVQAYRA